MEKTPSGGGPKGMGGLLLLDGSAAEEVATAPPERASAIPQPMLPLLGEDVAGGSVNDEGEPKELQ